MGTYGQWPFSILPDTVMIPGPAGPEGPAGDSITAAPGPPPPEGITGVVVYIDTTTGDVYTWEVAP